MSKVLVLDIGGSAVKYALMDKDSAQMLEKGKIPVDTSPGGDKQERHEQFADTLADLFARFQSEAEGVAISLPGNIDSDTGYVNTPGALWYNQETYFADTLKKAIREKTGREVLVTLENDGKAAALAEVWKGNLQGIDNGVVVILGTGIGGGIIINGQLYKGTTYFAGELSFMKTDFSSQALGSCAGMAGSAVGFVNRILEEAGLDKESHDGRDAFALIEAGDEKALAALDAYLDVIDGMLFNLTITLDPGRILIGGGISAQPILVEKLREKFHSRIESFPILMPKPEVEVCRFRNDSNLIGALYNYNLIEQSM